MTKTYICLAIVLLAAASLLSCSSGDPNIGRILISIAVTPETADAKNSPNGQVIFTATGTYSLSPITGPLTFAAPYAGQFAVDNPATGTIANVVTTGNSTVTVQCATNATGTAFVVASALTNNGTTTEVSGSGQLTCP
jgi:hypothetical protein